ncbi:MAG TPA: sulfatase-like hydrolase/transferase [Thermoanaerobaculia bacterium]|nr:sulfatase-like hydrolase/transferase [Thermoanaerobaculia bacterium]
MRCPVARRSSLVVTLCALLACGGETTRSGGAAEERERASAAASAPVGLDSVDLDAESILLVTVDTLRYDALGHAGNPRASTPTLDRLAAAGLVFERAYAHNVVTLPSHANILTGLLPYQHGVRDNDGFVLPVAVPTAASWLSERGFATAAFVAAFPLDRRFGLDRGFDRYDDRYPRAEGERPGDEVVAGALDWWRSHAGERRFLWVHLYEPHAPYEPPHWILTSGAPADPYLGEVSAVDAYLAPLLELVLDSEEAVLVVFTSDHGEALGEHGEPTHGLFAYESVLRVPLLLWAPALEPGRRADVAAHVDLLPTMLAAVRVEPPPGLPGRDLLATGGSRPVYFEALTSTLERGWAPLRGILEGADKLIELPLPELYDVVADPAERRNLIAERPDLARRLARELPEESVWPPLRDPDAPAAEEELRALGYLGGSAPRRETYSIEDDPKNLVHLHRKIYEALDHLNGGRLTDAEVLLREIVAERADMGTAHHYLAQVLLAQERVLEAIEVMERSRDARLASPRLLRQLGLSLAEVGRHDEAVAVLEPLAEQGDTRALHDLGRALSEAGDQAEAESVLQRVLERDPADPEAHQTRALVALRRGEPREALALAERATELDDGLSLAWNLRGAASHQLGERRRALEAWERAVELDPSNFDALFNIALVAEELGETSRLRWALERFVATAPPQRYGPQLELARRRLEDPGS